MDPLIARLKDINPAKLTLDNNPFSITAKKLADIFIGNILAGQESEKIVLDIMEQIPESQKSTSTQVDVQGFVDGTILRLAEKHLKMDLGSDGFLKDSEVVKKQISHLERDKLKQVNAVILHRTGSSSAVDTIKHYKDPKTKFGAHFLIDLDGTIYQIGSLSKTMDHVGKIKSKCYEENTCSIDEKQAIKKMEVLVGKKPNGAVLVHHHEEAKPYVQRYPMNSDSIGIEVVGIFDPAHGGYTASTDAQKQSIHYLVEKLKSHYGLTNTDIYPHTKISRKDEFHSEGKYLGY